MAESVDAKPGAALLYIGGTSLRRAAFLACVPATHVVRVAWRIAQILRSGTIESGGECHTADQSAK